MSLGKIVKKIIKKPLLWLLDLMRSDIEKWRKGQGPQ